MLDSINKSSLAAAIFIFGIISLGGGASLISIHNLSNALNESQRTSALLQAHQSADMMHDALRADAIAAIIARDPASGLQIDAVETDVHDHLTEFRAMIARETELARTEQERAALQSVQEPLNVYSAAAENIITLAKVDPNAALAALPSFFIQFHQLEISMEAVTDTIAGSDAAAAAESRHDSVWGMWIQAGLLLISLMFTFGLAVIARRFIAQPLISVTHELERLSGGDLNITPPCLARRDEIGALSRSLKHFRDAAFRSRALQETMDQQRAANETAQRQTEHHARAEAENVVVSTFGQGLLRLSQGDLTYRLHADLPPAYEDLRTNFNTAMQHMEETLRVITECAQSVHVGASEITQAADDLSRRTEQHAASLEETAAALDELTATVKGSALGADNANKVARSALEDAEHGAVIVTQAARAMGEIEKSSQQISQIIGVIDEIAFQTNLLALNAGVEAARAGDAGRGFAVVALEVRSLAQRSAEAAKEIKTLISTSSQQVSAGVNLVDESGGALTKIKSRVSEVHELITQIARSASEQSTALAQVNVAINHMDQGTQQNAAMVEESTAASQALSREAEALDNLVRKFEIGETAKRAPSKRRAA